MDYDKRLFEIRDLLDFHDYNEKELRSIIKKLDETIEYIAEIKREYMKRKYEKK